jgi:hypothetical protein
LQKKVVSASNKEIYNQCIMFHIWLRFENDDLRYSQQFSPYLQEYLFSATRIEYDMDVPLENVSGWIRFPHDVGSLGRFPLERRTEWIRRMIIQLIAQMPYSRSFVTLPPWRHREPLSLMHLFLWVEKWVGLEPVRFPKKRVLFEQLALRYISLRDQLMNLLQIEWKEAPTSSHVHFPNLRSWHEAIRQLQRQEVDWDVLESSHESESESESERMEELQYSEKEKIIEMERIKDREQREKNRLVLYF